MIEIRRSSPELPDASEEKERPGEEALPAPMEGDTPISAEFSAFYPDGTAEASEIVLRDREGFGLALRINPTTARVKILEVERK